MNEPVNQHFIQQSPMHIFNNRPSTWQDLQNFVGKLFREIGYAVEVSKVISLVGVIKKLMFLCKTQKVNTAPPS